MKQILITGVNSYIGSSLRRYLLEYNEKKAETYYAVDSISLRESSWREADFHGYDTIFHMVGKAHADIGHVTQEEKAAYYQVNTELAVETARKARDAGIPQFVYMSSVIVYGDSAGVGKEKHITADTIPEPANFYGDSKWQAEQQLQALETDNFRVDIIRAPMIYGKGGKGNYQMLAKLADRLPFFPSLENQRSMLYIENLTEFLRLLAEAGTGGVFWPQNEEYVTTAKMVQAIGAAKGRRIRLLPVLNPFVRLASLLPGKPGGMANKAFGSLTIDKQLSRQGIDGYQLYTMEESVKRSVYED